MKAWVLHNVNDFRFEDKSKPEIKAGEVLVQVKAAGICGSDIPRVYQTGAHVHPLILGHEFSGEVIQDGDLSDEGWLGKRVGIFPLIPCGKCVPCRNKQYEMCRDYSYLGSRRDGGFAEYVAVPKANLIELPDNVTYEQAAMLEPMSVAVHAMRRGFSLIEGDISDKTVAVWGLGTVGLLLVMFLRQVGVRNILAIGNKDFQKERFIDIGMAEEQYCDVKQMDATEWIFHKTNGQGVDLFFECVGKNEVFSEGIELTAPAGGIALVGNPYSDMYLEKNIYWKLLRKQLKVTGTWNSSFTYEDTDDWHYVIDCLKDKKISPENLITHRYTLEDLEKGFHIMRDKTEDYVKIMRSI